MTVTYEVPESLRSLRQSDFGTILSCGRKLYLSKGEGHPRRSSRKMMVGTSFHKGVECLYRSVLLGDRVEITEAKSQAVCSVQVGFSLADPADMELGPKETLESAIIDAGSLLCRGLDYYYDRIFPVIASLGEPAAIEHRVEFSYRGFAINGTCDLVDGVSCLRDHKFSQGYLAKSWPDSYLAQLARYVWFLSLDGIKVEDLSLDMVSYSRANKAKDPRIDHHSYTLAETGLDIGTIQRMGKESVDAALDLIEAGVFPRFSMNSFGLGCGMCPYRGSLCAGAMAKTA